MNCLSVEVYSLIGIKYCCWWAANIFTIEFFDALSIGVSFVAAVQLCIKRDVFIYTSLSYDILPLISYTIMKL